MHDLLYHWGLGRQSRRTVAAGVAALLLIAGNAEARTSWEVSGQLSSGYASNPNPGALDQNGTAIPSTGDGLLQLSPAASLTIQTGRAIHQLQYSFSGTIYFKGNEASSYNNLADWVWLNNPNKKLRTRTFINFTQGQQNAFSLSSAYLSQPKLQPRGDVVFVSAAAGESLHYEIDPWWNIGHAFALSFYHPVAFDVPQASNVNLNAEVDVLRRLTHGLSVGLQLSGAYNNQLSFLNTFQQLERFPTEHSQIFSLTAELNLDFGRYWNLELNAGVLEASGTCNNTDATLNSPAPGTRIATTCNPGGADPATVNNGSFISEIYVQPSAFLGLTYNYPTGSSLGFSAEHTAVTALEVGGTFRSEQFRFSGKLALGPAFREKWFLAFDAGYNYNKQVILHLNQLGAAIHTVVFNGIVEWKLSDLLQLSLRYQLTTQSDPPPALFALTAGFARHDVLAGLTVRFPTQRRRVRIRAGATRHQAGRLDGQRWQQLFGPSPDRAPANKPASNAGPPAQSPSGR